MKRITGLFFILCLILLLTGCSNTQSKIQELMQTNSAAKIKNNYTEILESLLTFKEKLNLRNPNYFDKELSNTITKNIKKRVDTIKLERDNQELKSYSQYLKVAFDKNPNIKNRNDLLILGMYKLVYEAYNIQAGYQITALNYDIKKLQKLYYNLNSLRWRIKSYKDGNNNYLFLTWQKNWQIELERSINQGKVVSWEMIKNLEFIKEKKETLFESSNFSFEILLSGMIYNVKTTLKDVGEEPVDVSIKAMKSLILFI